MSPIRRVRVPVETMMARAAEALAAGGKGGIVCPRCACKQFAVKDTWDVKGGRRRKRQCRSCGAMFSTLER